MKKFAINHLLKIQPYQPGKPIDEVKRELGLKDVIKLASNENPYGPSPKVLKAIQREAREINRYPDGGCFYLRQELAKRLKISPERLVFGNGSDEVIILTMRAFVSHGDEIIVAKPTFMIYALAAKIIGARVKEIPLKEFRYDLEAMAKAVTAKTRVVFIGNPDNPGGTYVRQQDLRKFLRQIRKDILVFIDEAYYEYASVNKDYPDSLTLFKSYKNLIISRTFSKMYGLAGLRIGYGIADQTIISIFDRIRDPFNVNSLAQAAALACLNDQRYYRQIAKKIESQRQYLYRQLTAAGVRFVRTATNFILVNTGRNASAAARQLLSKGIIVRDMTCWGLNDFIRVTIGTRDENQKFIAALRLIKR